MSAPNLERFEAEVAPGKRGAAIDEAIDLWLAEKRRAQIHADFEEFGRDEEAQALYAQVDREWAPLSDEVWAALGDEEEWPQPVLVFPRGYAAYEAEMKEVETRDAK